MPAQEIDWVEIDHGHDPRELSDHFPVIVRLDFSDDGTAPAPGGGRAVVKIEWLLPNPSGDERQNEAAALTNIGGAPISLSGWTLRDKAHTTWALDSLGTLGPGQSAEILRHGQAMALNNGGDLVDLVDGAGMVHDSVQYDDAGEGERIDFQ